MNPNLPLFRGDGERPILELPVDDSCVCTLKQMGEQSVRLTLATASPTDLRAGDWFEWRGVRYALAEEPDYKRADGLYSYTLTFYAPGHRLSYLLHKDEGSLSFPYAGTLAQQLDALYTSIGREASGFTLEIEAGIEGADELRHLEFDRTYCLDALTRICEAFATEWRIDGSRIRIGRFRTAPVGLFRYGRDRGLYSLEKVGVSNTAVVTRLYGYGATENLPEGYGSERLRFAGTGGASYLEKNVAKYGLREEAVEFDDIYPRLEGATIGEVRTPADIASASGWTVTVRLPADCDDIVIGRDQADPQIRFTSGALMGEGFTITAYRSDTHELDFNVSEDNGYRLPSETRRPAPGDSFVLLGIVMPPSYVARAEAELRDRTQQELDLRSEKRYAYRLEIDPRYVRRESIRIGLGDTVLVQEADESVDPVEIRVSEVSYPLPDPDRLSVVLSDTPVYTSYAEKIENDIAEADERIEAVRRSGTRFTRRVWRDALQTMEMLRNGMQGYSDSIQPVAVQTMQLLVGDESLQFRFVASRQHPTVVAPVSYNASLGRLEIASATLQHLTLGSREITGRRDETKGLFWAMPSYTSRLFGYEERDEAYYLYARVPRDSSSGGGEYQLERSPVGLEDESGYYHLLVGILNSEIEGSRSYTDLYGFTEIAPGRITADRVVSQDGLNFMDFVNNSFRVGDSASSLSWNTADTPGRLAVRNASFEIESGSKSMVRFDGQNGAGHVAGGKLRWDASGNLVAESGTFNNVVINGSFRCAFHDGKYVLFPGDGAALVMPGLHDNNNIIVPGGHEQLIDIPFITENNGFRATIVNDDFGKYTAYSYLKAIAPKNKYFFEAGKEYDELYIDPKEGVELLGFGEGEEFRGWIVLNRFYVGKKTTPDPKIPAVLCSGYVDQDGRLAEQIGYIQCKAEKDTLLDNGVYRINHNIGHLEYFIQVTPRNTDFYRDWYKINPIILQKNANDVLIGMFDSIKECVGVNYGFEFCITTWK